jgi:hypothetical protein
VGSEITLTTSGGSGTGSISYALTGSNCTLASDKLTASAGTTCSIIATKASDTSYVEASSAALVFEFKEPYPYPGAASIALSLGAEAPYVGMTLTITEGGWAYFPEQFEYKWFRNGILISGQTNRTYKIADADAGMKISGEFTAYRTGYSKFTSRSSETTPVLKLFNLKTRPTIAGTSRIGNSLNAAEGTWPAGTNFGYQWYRGFNLVPDATSKNYTLTSADNNQYIQVRIEATLAGYKATSRISTIFTVGNPTFARNTAYKKVTDEIPTTSFDISTLNTVVSPTVNSILVQNEVDNLIKTIAFWHLEDSLSNLEIVYISPDDLIWTSAYFTSKGYSLTPSGISITRWIQDGCNFALTFKSGEKNIFFQCLHAGQTANTFRQTGPHEISHVWQMLFEDVYLRSPTWILEGSASFYGLAIGVSPLEADGINIDKYSKSYGNGYDQWGGFPSGTNEIFRIMSLGDSIQLEDTLRWISQAGIGRVHTQYLVGGLIFEYLMVNFGQQKFLDFFTNAQNKFDIHPNKNYLSYAEWRGLISQGFEETYGFDYSGLTKAAAGYISMRSIQIQSE